MNDVIVYAKKAREAFQNYITKNNSIDIDKCRKISQYINNIELLSSDESIELTDFINENSFDFIHLADVYTIKNDKYILKRRLTRSMPIKPSKPTSSIHEARGDFSSFAGINKPIKVRKLKKFKPKITK